MRLSFKKDNLLGPREKCRNMLNFTITNDYKISQFDIKYYRLILNILFSYKTSKMYFTHNEP